MEVVISKNQIESILKENVSSEEQRISPKTFPIERYSGNLDFNDTILALKVKIQNKKIHSLTFEATKTKIEKISETEFLSKKFKPKFIALRSTAGSESSPKEMVESTARISYSIENKKKKAVSQLSFSFNPKDNKLVVFSKGANLNQNENYLEIGIPENDTHLSLKLSATIPLTPVVENNETTHSISDLIDSEIKKNSTASKISEKKKKRSKK